MLTLHSRDMPISTYQTTAIKTPHVNNINFTAPKIKDYKYFTFSPVLDSYTFRVWFI